RAAAGARAGLRGSGARVGNVPASSAAGTDDARPDQGTASEGEDRHPLLNTLITGARVLTLNDRFDVVTGDVGLVEGRIAFVGTPNAQQGSLRFDATV